jgi:hypothetical protein
MVRRKYPKTKSDKPKKEKRGRESIYDSKIHPTIAENACAQQGLTNLQLSNLFDISIKTLDGWYVRYPELKEAVQRGRDNFDSESVESALLKRALGYEYEERTIEEIKVKAEDAEGKITKIPGKKITVHKKALPPETKACFLWLINRHKKRWNDAKNININSEQTNNYKISFEEQQLKDMSPDELRVMEKFASAIYKADRKGDLGEIAERLH